MTDGMDKHDDTDMVAGRLGGAPGTDRARGATPGARSHYGMDRLGITSLAEPDLAEETYLSPELDSSQADAADALPDVFTEPQRTARSKPRPGRPSRPAQPTDNSTAPQQHRRLLLAGPPVAILAIVLLLILWGSGGDDDAPARASANSGSAGQQRARAAVGPPPHAAGQRRPGQPANNRFAGRMAGRPGRSMPK